MKPIKVKKEFSAYGEWYVVGDELKGLSYETIVQLNEKGFIEPLSVTELREYRNNIKKEEK